MKFHGFQDEIGRVDIYHQEGYIPVYLIIEANETKESPCYEIMDKSFRYVLQTSYASCNCKKHSQN
jgi:hypothetical protein